MVALLHEVWIYGGTSEIMKTIIARDLTASGPRLPPAADYALLSPSPLDEVMRSWGHGRPSQQVRPSELTGARTAICDVPQRHT